jgi:uncharacterized membrane protein YraQ (UPF0718 family)
MIAKSSVASRSIWGTYSVLILAVGVSVAAGLLIRSGQAPRISDFATVFTSILFEAFPFVLIGTIISSAIHLLVTPELLARIIPKNKFAGLLVASVAGFAFPICECANVPVTRRLVAKGLPTGVAVTFLLAVAIVNPVVLFSTWIAFGGDWKAVLLRGGLGMLVAILSGWLVGLVPGARSPLRDHVAATTEPSALGHEHGEDCACGKAGHCDHEEGYADASPCDCGHDHGSVALQGRAGWIGKLRAVLEHTGSELFTVGRFLIMGAAVAAVMQTLLPRSSLIGIGASPLISILALMFLAYILSLCSEADAFIAATFAAYFTPGAVMAFMVYGPMMDIKNTLMLIEGFKPRFVLMLFALTTVLCLLAGYAINSTGFWGGLL